MEIKTKDFILRPIKLTDTQRYFEMMQDPFTKRGFMCVPKNVEEAREEIKKEIIDFKSKEKFNKLFVIDINRKFCGYVVLQTQSFKPEDHRGRLHIALHPDCRGTGIIQKAVKTIVKYGFEKYKWAKIYGQCRSFNKGAIGVLKKSGFVLEGTLKKDAIKEGKYVNNLLWAIMNPKIGDNVK
ncbi:MAG: GNAT family N-acetyltransferase [archaeon]